MTQREYEYFMFKEKYCHEVVSESESKTDSVASSQILKPQVHVILEGTFTFKVYYGKKYYEKGKHKIDGNKRFLFVCVFIDKDRAVFEKKPMQISEDKKFWVFKVEDELKYTFNVSHGDHDVDIVLFTEIKKNLEKKFFKDCSQQRNLIIRHYDNKEYKTDENAYVNAPLVIKLKDCKKGGYCDLNRIY